MPPKPRPVMVRLIENVDMSGGLNACWPWTKARNEHGYGIMRVAGKNVRAHRVARFMGNDPGPHVKVRHSCDNPPCCNPLHLLVGTQADNVADMHERNRRRYTSRYTEEDVAEMRRLSETMTNTAIAERYQCSQSYVSMLLSGKRGVTI